MLPSTDGQTNARTGACYNGSLSLEREQWQYTSGVWCLCIVVLEATCTLDQGIVHDSWGRAV